MKNKIFLIPILALGTLLGACKEKIDPIYIDEWLDNAKQPFESYWPARFLFKEENGETILYKDYGLSIANEIKQAVKEIEATPIDEIRHKILPLMEYWVYADVGKFTECKFSFYSDGILETHATYENSKSGIISYDEQNFQYKLGEEKISSLYETFKNRYAEIIDDRTKEDVENQNKVNIENFLEAMDSSKEVHYVLYNNKETNNQESKRIQDNDLSYLADIKELEFTKLDKTGYIYTTSASYYVDNEWSLVIPEDSQNEIAVCYININSKYKEISVFSQKWYFAHYSVNSTKLTSLLEKIKNQISN